MRHKKTPSKNDDALPICLGLQFVYISFDGQKLKSHMINK